MSKQQQECVSPPTTSLSSADISSCHRRLSSSSLASPPPFLCLRCKQPFTHLHQHHNNNTANSISPPPSSTSVPVPVHCQKCLSVTSHLPNPILSILCIAGIFTFFLAAGAAHENLFSFRFKVPTPAAETPTNQQQQPEERFTYSVFLVFFCCVVNTLCAGMITIFIYGLDGFLSVIKQVDSLTRRHLSIASSSYVTSLLTSNYALTHVNYPTQVLIKSAKTVPIVVGGFVQYRKIYPWYDYFSVVVVTSGLALFNLEKMLAPKTTPNAVMGDNNGNSSSGSSSGAATDEMFTMGCGILLLIVALICDGITGPTQDQLLSKRPQLTSLNIMLTMNFYGAILSGIVCVVVEGGTAAISFCCRHPQIGFMLSCFAIASCLGQFCIFWGLTLMGSLHLAMVTTVRKFCSIVVSIILYEHKVSWLQWSCIVSIFGSLALQAICSNRHKKKQKAIISRQNVNAKNE
eukprot:GHVS01104905.1.p1 GENE.GHVS01104905.1~~GHVS01104905.1.p1  ORF type:complete len:461 (+),score=82.76 GHVS01104905.1:124-1506(+)